MQAQELEILLQHMHHMRKAADSMAHALERSSSVDYDAYQYAKGLINQFNITESRLAGALKTIKDQLHNGK